MRGLFWRRRNKRLAARLDTVVETSERTRKSYRRKAPRVAIDTSYLDQPHTGPGEPSGAPEVAIDDANYDVLMEGNAALDVANWEEPPEGAEADEDFAVEDLASESLALLEMAVERCEQAEQREAETQELLTAAQAEAERQREEVGRSEAEARDAIAARDTAQAQLHETSEAVAALERELTALREMAVDGESKSGSAADGDESRHEIEQLRVRVAELEQQAVAQQSAQSALENERDEAARLAVDLQEEVVSLRELKQQYDDTIAREQVAGERESEARDDVQRLGAELARVSAVLEDEQTARRTAELQRDEAVGRTNGLQQQVASLSEVQSQNEQAIARVAAVSQDIEEQHAIAARLSEELQAEKEARSMTEMQRDEAAKLAHDLHGELTGLREVKGHYDQTVAQNAELDKKLRAMQSEFEDKQTQLATLQAQIANHASERGEIESQRDEAANLVSELQGEIAGLREGQQQLDQAVAREREASEREAEIQQELEQQRSHVAEMEAQLKEEQVSRFAAEAQRDATAKVAADLQREVTELRAGKDDAGKSGKSQAKTRKAQELDSSAEESGEVAASSASSRSKAAAKKEDDEDERLRDLRMATDKPIIIHRTKTQAKNASKDKAPATSGTKAERKQKRVSSSLPATLHIDGTKTKFACTILDRSSSGVKLDIIPDKYADVHSLLDIDSEVTLAFDSAQERSSVACTVQWIEGSQCGVKYCGQFRTENTKARKKAPAKRASRKT